MIEIKRMPLGALASNCYIIATDNKEAVVIDPAASGEVEAYIELNDLKIGGIIITHGHFDHFAGVNALKRLSGAKVYAPELDSEMLASAEKSWAWFMQGNQFEPVVPDKTFSDGGRFTVSGIDFSVMGAPGHTAGSCLLFCESAGGFFSGDVLFKDGVGRTDGFSGSDRLMRESLAKISALSGDFKVYTGHGEITTLGEEKMYNPYLQK